MVVKSWDDRFALKRVGLDVTDQECDSQPCYGRAFSCSSSPKGRTKVNLEGTGFYIPPTVS